MTLLKTSYFSVFLIGTMLIVPLVFADSYNNKKKAIETANRKKKAIEAAKILNGGVSAPLQKEALPAETMKGTTDSLPAETMKGTTDSLPGETMKGVTESLPAEPMPGKGKPIPSKNKPLPPKKASKASRM